MSDYVARQTQHALTRGLGGKHCTGVKCNSHGADIPFFLRFLCRAYRLWYLEHLHNFFAKRRRSAVIAFLEVPTKYLRPSPQNPPKPHFGDQSQTARAKKLKLKTQLDMLKYSLWVQKAFR